MSLRPIDPIDLKSRMDAGTAILIDIREPDEYAREHIVGARLVPLSGFDAHDLDNEHGRTVVFHCKSGNRTAAHASRILARGFAEARMLAGGLDAWKAAGLPLHQDRSAPLELQRQVQLGAGSLVVIGVVLGLTLSSWFIALSALVGVGLIFAGATGFCGMANVLKRLPWNRRAFDVTA
jgi:rhodanese-related sulfurtransferase